MASDLLILSFVPYRLVYIEDLRSWSSDVNQVYKFTPSLGVFFIALFLYTVFRISDLRLMEKQNNELKIGAICIIT